MGTHSTQRVSPWGDWMDLKIESARWFTASGVYGGLKASDFAADQLDLTASAGIAGGSSPKPTFTFPGGSSPSQQIVGFWRHIKLPDFAVGRDQAPNLADWSGKQTEAMSDGGRRVALQMEVVLTSRSATNVIGAALAGAAFAAKYKGFGGKLLAAIGSNAIGTDAEDPVVAPNLLATANIAAGTFGSFGGASTTAFPDLALPSDTTSPAGSNVAPIFTPNGVCRLQAIYEIPNTVARATEIEVLFAFQFLAGARAVPVQVQYASYRWLKGGPQFAYPIDPNTAIQLQGDGTDDEEFEQPYIDTGVDEP